MYYYKNTHTHTQNSLQFQLQYSNYYSSNYTVTGGERKLADVACFSITEVCLNLMYKT